MAEPPDDLQTRITGWLEKQGYPLEMAVARAFRDQHFRVHQSYYFTDQNTSTVREIDVLVTHQGNLDGRLIRLVLPIECKRATDKPWVVFTDSSLRLDDAERVRYRAASPVGQKLLTSFATDPLLPGTALFAIPRSPGYAVTTALSDGKDKAYAAISSVVAATRALLACVHQSPIAVLFCPVVVLEGRLFSCHLTHASTVEVMEVPSAVLLWRNPIAEAPYTIVHLVTRNDMEALVDAAASTVRDLLRLDPETVGRAIGRPAGRVGADDPSIDF